MYPLFICLIEMVFFLPVVESGQKVWVRPRALVMVTIKSKESFLLCLGRSGIAKAMVERIWVAIECYM